MAVQGLLQRPCTNVYSELLTVAREQDLIWILEALQERHDSDAKWLKDRVDDFFSGAPGTRPSQAWS